MSNGEFNPAPAPEAEPMTHEQIYQQLRLIAFISDAFKKGETNSFGFTTGYNEHPKAIDRAFKPKGWQDPYTAHAYRFEALRDVMPGAPTTLDFTYGYSKTEHNIMIPEHIARFAYGAKKNPVLAAGPSRKQELTDVSIDSETFEVGVRETVMYFDRNGNQVVHVDSEGYPEDYKATVFPQMPKVDATQPPADGIITLRTVRHLGIPKNLRTNAARSQEKMKKPVSRKKFEKIVMDYDYELADLVIATDVLKDMVSAFRQVGMKIPKAKRSN